MRAEVSSFKTQVDAQGPRNKLVARELVLSITAQYYYSSGTR